MTPEQRLLPYRRLSTYRSNVATYKKRRAALREKYPNWRNGNPHYASEVRGLTLKIRTWNRSIRRLKQRHLKLAALDQFVCDFLEVDYSFINCVPKASGKNKLGATLDAQWSLFCKYAMESGLEGAHVAEYMGYKAIATPSRRRLSFTRSFTSNPDNHQLWKNFQQYQKHHQLPTITNRRRRSKNLPA